MATLKQEGLERDNEYKQNLIDKQSGTINTLREHENNLERLLQIERESRAKWRKAFLFAFIAFIIVLGILLYPLIPSKTAQNASESVTEVLESEVVEEPTPEAPETPEPPPEPTPEPPHKEVTVTVDTLNVRAEPSEDSELIAQVHLNDVLTAVGEPTEGWQTISLNDITCYVSSEFIADKQVEPPHKEQSKGIDWTLIGIIACGIVIVYILICCYVGWKNRY